ncbi:hypothetical protein FRB93_010981 [Tulasnella sp. JGI-2019a]|nr:hypothetical protein FRB93_010981 [Tulasnella sp. JGI-2019a]
MADNADILFSGTDSEDVTLLIRQVQRAALAKGYYQHDAFRADYLASRPTGAAMRWYFLLNDDTRNTWAPLCRSLIRDFPSSPTVLTPAAVSSLIRPPNNPDVSDVNPRLQRAIEDYLPRKILRLCCAPDVYA